MKHCFTFLLCIVLSEISIAASLYNEVEFRSLVASNSALKEGDMVTVLISEAASASATSNSNSDTSSSVGMFADDNKTLLEGNLGLKSDFSGGGAVKRSGRILAQISALVMSVENGLLTIQGEKDIVMNDETQTIKVSGVIRSSDITSDNTIHSSRIANASIEFLGEGVLSSSERPGWITRFFQWLF